MAEKPGTSSKRGGGGDEPAKKRLKLSINPIHIDFEFNNNGTGGLSICKHCKCELKGKNSTTLKKHLQSKHPKAYKEFENRHNEAVKAAESSKAKQVSVKPPTTGSNNNKGVMSALGRDISSYMDGPGSGKKYSHDDPRQKKINEDVAFLVASSTLPVSLTSLPAFKKLVFDLNPHVLVPEQSKVKKDINDLWEKVRDALEEGIRVARKIALTTDIWSSKNMKHSYLGITIHYFNPISKVRAANKIACREFPNPHTGEAIAKLIVDVCQEFGMNSKVNYILADNGSNMAASYKFMQDGGDLVVQDKENNAASVGDLFAVEESDLVDITSEHNTTEDVVDNFEEVEDIGSGSDDESDGEKASDGQDDEVEEEVMDYEARDEDIVRIFKRRGKKRGRCYAHTKQLPICKVNKQRNVAFGRVLTKTKKFVVKYRTSPKAKGILKSTSFQKSLLGYCKTRWYSDMAMAKSVIEAAEMEDKPLAKLSAEMNWSLNINAADVKVLKQYVELMEPFAKHTDVLGGENYSTLHMVYPALQDLFSHLEEMTKKFENLGKAGTGASKYCKNLEKEMKKYFAFVLDPKADSFDPVYYLATYFDPMYSAILTMEQKEIAINHLKELMKEQLEEMGEDWHETFEAFADKNESVSKSPVFRGFKHVSRMIASTSQTVTSMSTPFARDLEKYRSDCERIRFQGGQKAEGDAVDGSNPQQPEEVPMEDPLDYWVESESKYETLLPLIAEDILCIPATSTPSERLFSISGILSSGKMSNISPKVWCNMVDEYKF